MKYDLNYFIAKFKKIPESEWCIGAFELEGRHCARGHCGETMMGDTEESTALLEIVRMNTITGVNDGDLAEYRSFGKTPKQRVVNYLKHIKSLENEKRKNKDS